MRSKGLPGEASSGFTLVEVVLGLSILLCCTLALGLSLQAGAVAARGLREEQMLLARAQTFVDRISGQSFGNELEADPTASQIEEIFDGDSEAGNVSLNQLSRYPTIDGGWRFRLTDFPAPGEWKVCVDEDIDGNGFISGDLETGKRIFRVSVFFDDRLILRANRAKEVSL